MLGGVDTFIVHQHHMQIIIERLTINCDAGVTYGQFFVLLAAAFKQRPSI